MSVPYTTALEAIGYFLKSAFTAMDTLLTMDMLLAMSTWNCVKVMQGCESGVSYSESLSCCTLSDIGR